MQRPEQASGPGSALVSIVVPSFQQGRYLPFALEGLTRQTYPSVETAVFDNISTDTSGEVLRLFAGRVTRIVRARDRGQSDALRSGFGESGADVLGWLNADDMILPDTIERVTAIFDRHPEVDVVYGDCAFLTESGQFMGYFHDIQDFSLRDLLNFSDFIPQPSTFFRKSAYDAVGGIDPSLEYAMDWDLWCRMARAGHRFLRVNEVLAAARIHAAAKTSRGGLQRSRELMRVNHRHASFGIPFVALAHLYQRYVRRFAGPLAALPRWAWKTLLSAPRSNNFVQGVGPNGRVAPGRFRIRFPIFAEMRTLRLESPDITRLRLDAIFGSMGGARVQRDAQSVSWSMDPPVFASEVDLSGTLADGPETTVRVVWA